MGVLVVLERKRGTCMMAMVHAFELAAGDSAAARRVAEGHAALHLDVRALDGPPGEELVLLR